MTNRCHPRSERMACEPILKALINTLKPKDLVAIGLDAQAALSDLELEAIAVRRAKHRATRRDATDAARLP